MLIKNKSYAFTQCGGEYKTCPLFYYYPVFISCVFSIFFFLLNWHYWLL